MEKEGAFGGRPGGSAPAKTSSSEGAGTSAAQDLASNVAFPPGPSWQPSCNSAARKPDEDSSLSGLSDNGVPAAAGGGGEFSSSAGDFGIKAEEGQGSTSGISSSSAASSSSLREEPNGDDSSGKSSSSKPKKKKKPKLDRSKLRKGKWTVSLLWPTARSFVQLFPQLSRLTPVSGLLGYAYRWRKKSTHRASFTTSTPAS